jgi:diguanylate cyclase (GGDEF)-like protein/PAS domain S-box-containing protein
VTTERYRTRRRLPTWVVATVVVALSAVAVVGVVKLRQEADLVRGEQLALERMRSLTNEQSSLEWQAVAARGAAAELSRGIRSRREAMDAELARLAELGRQPDSQLTDAFHVHQEALEDEFVLLAARRFDEALVLGQRRVDPSLARFQGVLGRMLDESGGEARAAAFRATAATGLLVALAAVLIVLLARGFQRARSSLATADERALRRSERWFRSLVQNASELIAIVDPDTTVTYVTDSAVPLLGYLPEALVGRPLLELAHPDDVGGLRDAVSGAPTGRFECRLWTKDQSWVVLEWVRGTRPEEPGCILTGRDITQRKRLEHELRHQAFHDKLTGLANRALFEDRLTHGLATLARHGSGLAVLFVDLDDFKTVNDSLGHSAGDALLRAAGERLRSSLRDTDTAARLGGDEFGILLEGIADPQAALHTAQRVLASLEPHFEIDGRQLTVTGSVGVAPALSGRETMPDLMRNADLAMYEAKRRGGAQCRLFEDAMHEVALTRLELGGELQRAVEEEQFELHFQPIVSLERDAILGAEALLRWRHPERGLLAPAQFLPLAEESGLIVPLGRWVLEEAARALRTWQDEHPELPLYISANVSMRQLYDPDIVDHVRAALREAEVDAERFVIEITESFLADETEAPRQRLQQLRALGVRLAVDDFGTGYSALSYLQRFPIDMLKIDRSFVEHARPSSSSVNLVRSIVQLGQSLHLAIVAEGIEDAEQAHELRKMGVPAGQGYYFARPLAPERFTELLATGETRDRARSEVL